MHENLLAVVGNVVSDPQLRTSHTTGTPFATFRVASTPRRYNPATKAFEDGDTNYYSVTAFRSLAANVVASLKKGHPVVVHGRLRVNQFLRADGSPGTSVEIAANAVGHDLARGRATFAKAAGTVQVAGQDPMADPAVQASMAEGEPGPEGAGLGTEDAEGVPYDVVDPVTGELAGLPGRAAFARTADVAGPGSLDDPESDGSSLDEGDETGDEADDDLDGPSGRLSLAAV